MRDADTIVIGGGVVGTMAAALLAESGMRVLLLDHGDGAGSTSNAGSLHVQMQSRFMRLYPEKVPGLEAQLPSYPLGVARWQALEARLAADFELRMTGGLMVAESPEQLEFLGRKAERERELGLDVEVIEGAALRRLAPYLSPAIIGAEFCAEEGKLNPLKANAVLRRWAAAAGVARQDGCWVAGIEPVGGGFVVACAGGGTAVAPRLLLACGWGAGPLVRPFGIDLPGGAEPLHMNITEPAAPLIGHLVQHADRMITLKQLGTGQVVIGGGWPARAAQPPALELDSLISSATLAQHVVPALAPLRIIRCWAGNNTAIDGQGVIGPVPDAPGLFLAIPGDAGYTLGPLTAELAVAAMLALEPEIPLAPYDPARFSA